MLNPLSKDLSVMRQSMIFSGLEAISHNVNRRQQDLKLFEYGKTYHQFDEREEHKHMSLFVTGNTNLERWNSPTAKSDYFYFKGVITALLERLGIKNSKASPLKNDVFSEGVQLGFGKITLVEFGVVKKQILKHFDISQEVLYADIHWDNVLQVISSNTIKINDVPKYPESRRDFALLLNEDITFESIYMIAKKTEKKLLKDINLFDVYQGRKLPKGKKSYAVSFMFQDTHKTLTDKQVDKIMSKLQTNFEKELGAELR